MEQEIRVFGRGGLSGTVLYPLPRTADEQARLQLDNGAVVEVPASMLKRRADGGYDVPLGPEDLDQTVIPVIAEELAVGKRAVETGGVRVHRKVFEHEETVEMPLRKEQVDVRRVVINKDVEGPLPVRREGDRTIVPIVEEVLVVQKRYVLKEEIHITRSTRQELHRESVVVRRQEAEIERVDEDGRVRTEVPRRKPRSSILGE